MSDRSEAYRVSDDLVERVGRELARTGYAFAGIDLTDPYTADADYWNSQARAAIAVCMEEAAKVAGKWQQMYFEDEKVHSSNITEYIVADIRALIKEPT